MHKLKKAKIAKIKKVLLRTIYDFKDDCLAVNNGIINPITLEVTEFKPEIVTRIRLNVAYDPAATCPKFEKFIDECKSDKTLLQETAGYPLLPDYPYQKAIMLLGAGGQGKSVFLRIICDILGIENISAAALQTLVENRFATADLYCRLANVAGDLSDMALSKTATFKQLTGDDRIRAEKKGQDAFDFWNRAKLIFSANMLPPTKDKSGGYFRRWILIDFLREMVQHPNPHLAAELLEERSGIFNWMLTGARRVTAQGFTYTTDPEKMERRYIERSEPIIKFLEFACSEDFDGFIESQTLYTAYNNWAKATRGKKMSGREFINAMKNQNTYSVEYGRKTTYVTGEPRPVGFFGLNFKPAIPGKNVECRPECRPECTLDKFGVKAEA